MFRSSLTFAGGLLLLAWYMANPAADQVRATGGAADQARLAGAGIPAAAVVPPPATGSRVSASGMLAQGAISPFAMMPVPAGGQFVTAALPASGNESLRQQLEDNLREYRSGALTPEEKRRIKQALQRLLQDTRARALIVDHFFSTAAPQLAQSMYALLRDADIKDVGLLEELIRRDSANAQSGFSARIVDLIADLGTQSQARYSTLIDGYLAQMARNADPQMHQEAAFRRIWYLNQHQPYNLALQEASLSDSAPMVREAVYSLIEQRIASQALSGQAQLAAALNGLLRADQVGIPAQEKARVAALLQAIQAQGT